MIVEKEQTGNPEPIHHGCVTGGREESAEVKAVISCPSDRFFKGKEDTHTRPMFCNIIFLALGWHLLHSENSLNYYVVWNRIYLKSKDIHMGHMKEDRKK